MPHLTRGRNHFVVVVFIFIGLETIELSLARVIQRIEAGGHDVPDEKLVTRFVAEFTAGALGRAPRSVAA